MTTAVSSDGPGGANALVIQPDGRLVAAGDSFEVSEDAAEGLRDQSIFTESKTTKTPKESN